MSRFTYPLLAKIIYRHANLLLTPLFLALTILSLGGLFVSDKYWYPLVVNVLILVVLNIFYFRMYKYFPFVIEMDDEKMVCKNFMNKRKEVEIKFADVKKIEGGIFSGRAVNPIYIYDGRNKVVVGVNPHLNDFNRFLALLLSKIDRELYKSLLGRIELLGKAAEELKSKRGNKKARKERAKK